MDGIIPGAMFLRLPMSVLARGSCHLGRGGRRACCAAGWDIAATGPRAAVPLLTCVPPPASQWPSAWRWTSSRQLQGTSRTSTRPSRTSTLPTTRARTRCAAGLFRDRGLKVSIVIPVPPVLPAHPLAVVLRTESLARFLSCPARRCAAEGEGDDQVQPGAEFAHGRGGGGQVCCRAHLLLRQGPHDQVGDGAEPTQRAGGAEAGSASPPVAWLPCGSASLLLRAPTPELRAAVLTPAPPVASVTLQHRPV